MQHWACPPNWCASQDEPGSRSGSRRKGTRCNLTGIRRWGFRCGWACTPSPTRRSRTIYQLSRAQAASQVIQAWQSRSRVHKPHLAWFLGEKSNSSYFEWLQRVLTALGQTSAISASHYDSQRMWNRNVLTSRWYKANGLGMSSCVNQSEWERQQSKLTKQRCFCRSVESPPLRRLV